MAVFVFGAGFALYYYAFKKGIVDPQDMKWGKNDDDLPDEELLDDDDTGIDVDTDEVNTGSDFLDKWFQFGGGYYGTMAMVKFADLELQQLREFLNNWKGVDALVDGLGVGTLINFLIEQVMNAIWASVWFFDYIVRFSFFELALFILVTWIAYEGSLRFAIKRSV